MFKRAAGLGFPGGSAEIGTLAPLRGLANWRVGTTSFVAAFNSSHFCMAGRPVPKPEDML